MLTIDAIYNQVNKLTAELIRTGLCDAQNFPSRRKYPGNVEEIGIHNTEHSIFLKNVPYSEMYSQLTAMKMFNMKMIDGALISLFYRFVSGHLSSHRLSFFPSPDLEMFQNVPDVYMNDELYSDIIDKRIVTIPIRFDFDKRETVYKPIEHPISHLTLGQYENCRIPVTAALTPYQFLSFIIINFYHTAYQKYHHFFTLYDDCFEATIFDAERGLLHMCIPIYGR